jgi:uncharacterized membrane protein
MSASSPTLPEHWRTVASLSLLALMAWCVAWEAVVAPVRPGSAWLVLKIVPLLLPLRGITQGKVYTYQWASMLVLLYLAEGIVRLMSDLSPASRFMAAGEIVLASMFFAACLLYAGPAKRAARAAAKQAADRPANQTADTTRENVS